MWGFGLRQRESFTCTVVLQASASGPSQRIPVAVCRTRRGARTMLNVLSHLPDATPIVRERHAFVSPTGCGLPTATVAHVVMCLDGDDEIVTLVTDQESMADKRQLELNRCGFVAWVVSMELGI